VTRDGRERITHTAARRVSIATPKRTEPTKAARGIPDTPVDDLDDVTHVIDGKRSASKASAPRKQEPAAVAPPAATPPAAAPPAAAPPAVAPPAAAPPAKPAAGAPAPAAKLAPEVRPAMVRKATMQLVDEGFESLLETSTPPPAPPPPAIEPPPAPPSPAVAATPAPASKPAASPAPAAKPAATPPVEAKPAASPPAASGLLSQRVAVIAGPNGEARIVALEGLATVPEGAIAAIVVPLAAADGEALARLLRVAEPKPGGSTGR
jgi:hypothetical protein